MGSTKEIQTRMKSIQDTMKITNAMYMISSTKLRKAKKNLEETEPYFYTLQTMVSYYVCCLVGIFVVAARLRKNRNGI